MALFKGLIFGGAYLRREICVLKSIGPALQLEGNLQFLLCFTFYLFESKFQVQAPRGAGETILTDGFLRCEFGGLIHGGAYFRNFTVLPKSAYFRNRFLISLPKGLAQSFSVFSSSCVQFIYGGPCHGKSQSLDSAALGILTLKVRFCTLSILSTIQKRSYVISYPYHPRPRERNI